VSYLSLFYTRFEFGRRLSLFYGQAAVGGALGGVISYAVFSRFQDKVEEHGEKGNATLGAEWKPWQVLFLLEGTLTIIIALVGYFWLPHSAATAWFLTPEEREYATQRVVRDLATQTETTEGIEDDEDEELYQNEHDRGLLHPTKRRRMAESVTDDRGLAAHDIVFAFVSPKIWHILVCNILSAVPVYAFQVFLPLVLAPLTQTPNPALVNLLTAPPYVCGAVTLYLFASYSDRHRSRIMPILAGLAIVLIGLTTVVLLPTSHGFVIPRYIALNVLLAGTFVASPLTVAWVSGNTPSPGKRAVLLGINGWGNFAGVLSALIFKPKYAESGYVVPFWWTLLCVGLSGVGYVLFYRTLKRENKRRELVLKSWDNEDVERENADGRGPVQDEHRMLIFLIGLLRRIRYTRRGAALLKEAIEGGREGDEKLTFVYGL
jgi:hypothetical protein